LPGDKKPLEKVYCCGCCDLGVVDLGVVVPVCPGVDVLGRGADGVPAAGCGGTPDLVL
jgi:hypothetical protein